LAGHVIAKSLDRLVIRVEATENEVDDSGGDRR